MMARVDMKPVFDVNAIAERLRQHVPDAMREPAQWLVWKLEPGPKKQRKVPYYVDGVRRSGVQGSPKDRKKLATFGAAIEAFGRGSYAGVGFAFLPGDGLIGIDIDGQIDDAGTLAPRAAKIVEACASYTEFSPSRRGVHIIVAGDSETFKSNDIGLEVFCGRQFFTVTGDSFPNAPQHVAAISPKVISRLRKTVDKAKGRTNAATPPAHDNYADLADALGVLSPDVGYEEWIRIGMGIHADLGEAGFTLWNSWSSRGAKYQGEDDLRSHWKSFSIKPGGATGASIFMAARAAGWRPRSARVDTRPGGAAAHAATAESVERDLASSPPIDILRAMSAPPLRIDDAPVVMGRFADAQSRATGFDVSILLAGCVGAACAMLSDEVRLCVSPRSSYYESPRLWLAVVGGPGAGKSPGIKQAMSPVYAIHRELLDAWTKASEEVQDPDPPPALYTSDATTEALAELLRASDRGILYMTDELEAWLSAHDAYRTGAGKDRGEWLRLYDGGPHQVHRIRRGAFFVPNWGASLLSATTPAALSKLSAKLPDDGLLQRILLVLARPRELPRETSLHVDTKQAAEAWADALRRLYGFPAGVVHLTPDASAAFAAEQEELHRVTIAFEDVHPPYASHLAKRSAMLARLALVFQALDGEMYGNVISGKVMAMAIRFMRRQERHAQAVYGSMLGADTGMALAKDIGRSILAANLHNFNRRELTHKCKAFRGAEEATRKAALSLLSDCGWLFGGVESMTYGAEWLVDDRVHTLFAAHGEAARARRAAVRDRLMTSGEEL